MALDPNLYWAFVAIGVTFVFYGGDKILELYNPNSRLIKWIKFVLGAVMFVFGVLILWTVASAGVA